MTKITLRKASKIRNRLMSNLTDLQTKVNNVQLHLNVYNPNVVGELDAELTKFTESYVRYSQVSRVLFSIREKISVAGNAHNVSGLLADREALAGQLRTVSRVISLARPRLPEATLAAQIAGVVSRLEKSDYGHDQLAVAFIPEEVLEGIRADQLVLQTALDVVQDKLEAINTSVTIDLTDEELALLKSERVAV